MALRWALSAAESVGGVFNYHHCDAVEMRDREASQAPQPFSLAGPSVQPARLGPVTLPLSSLTGRADGTIELRTSRGWRWSVWQLCPGWRGQLRFHLTSHCGEAGGNS